MALSNKLMAGTIFATACLIGYGIYDYPRPHNFITVEVAPVEMEELPNVTEIISESASHAEEAAQATLYPEPVAKPPKDFKTRYALAKTTPIKIWQAKEGKQFKREQLQQTARAVLERTGFAKPSDGMISLLVGTCYTESNGGMYVTSQMGGPELGIMQIHPNTINYLVLMLRSQHPDIYENAQTFWNAKLTPEENWTNNVPLGMFFAAVKYWGVYGNRVNELAEDEQARARMYKEAYNSVEGKGTPEKYLALCQYYGV